MDSVNANSTSYLTVKFYNDLNALDIPNSVLYKINEVSTGKVIRDFTTLLPADTIKITLTTTDNTLINHEHSSEIHEVTIEADYGEKDSLIVSYQYKVIKIPFAR